MNEIILKSFISNLSLSQKKLNTHILIIMKLTY